MKTWTVCFMTTGGVSVEADTEEEVLNWFRSDAGQTAAWMCLSDEITITEVLCEEI